MLTKIDPIMEKFINFASEHEHDWHLDVGAAYGITTLAALAKGAKIMANDLDSRHLDAIEQSLVGKDQKDRLRLCVQDIRYLSMATIPTLGSVLFSRVLHFFSGEEILECLEKIKTKLRSGGKIFMVNETPYFGTAKAFIPEYLKRKAANKAWPGYLSIEETKYYWEASKRPFVTTPVHLFDAELIQKIAKTLKLTVENIGYLNRSGYFPKDALYDGRESIWAILCKS